MSLIFLVFLGCPVITDADVDKALDQDGDGFVATIHGGDDCNDDDPRIYPGAPDPWYDGELYDCDRTDDFDADGDGLPFDDDCDDDDPEVTGPVEWFVDADFDSSGTGAPVLACDQGPGWALTAGDCDDANSNLHPLATERCNGVDDDCDGFVDDEDPTVDPGGFIITYEDRDGDGVGTGDPSQACIPPVGWAAIDGDCDDDDPNNTPGAFERCDGADNDCDGVIDDDDDNLDPSTTTWYIDDDGDGYGDDTTADPLLRCLGNTGEVNVGGDCDDDDDELSPGAEERCDGIDNDCDGLLDESDPDVILPIWYLDVDEDGVGDSDFSAASCLAPDGYVPRGEDCDDDDPDLGAPVQVLEDADGDGFGANVLSELCDPPTGVILIGGDCNDDDPSVNPDADDEPYDGIDRDCSGTSDFDADQDGQDSSDYGGLDCNDGDPATYDGAPEVWYDDIDQDCRGGSDYDADVDGFEAPVAGGDDCDDFDPESYPGAPEVWGDGVDQDCGIFDDLDTDMDGLPDMDGCTSITQVNVPGDEPSLQAAVLAAADCTEILLASGDHVAVNLDAGSLRLLIRSTEGARVLGNTSQPMFRTNGFLGLAGLELEGGMGMIEAGTSRVVLSDVYAHDSQEYVHVVHFDPDAVADLWLRYSTFERTNGIVESDAGHIDVQGVLGIDLYEDLYIFYVYGTDVTMRDVRIEDSWADRFLITDDSVVDITDVELIDNRIDPMVMWDVTGVVERVTVEGNSFTRIENEFWGLEPGSLVVRDFEMRNNILDLNAYTLPTFPRIFYLRNVLVEGMTVVGNTFIEQGINDLHTFDMSSDAQMDNLLFVGNLVDDAVYCFQPALLRYATIAGNTGNGVAADGSCRLDHSIVAFNTGYGVANAPSVVYSDVYGNDGGDFVAMVNPVGVNGTLAVDPGFQTFDLGLPPAYMDVHLRPDSTLRDAGDPAELDVDGTVADMGAYGGADGEDDLIDSDLDGLPDPWELRHGLDPTIDDALLDPDGDELDNLGEFLKGTLPQVADTDADQVNDEDDDYPLDADDA